MQPFIKSQVILIGLLCLLTLKAGATHIYGGQMTYKSLENDDYLITLELDRDCLGTSPITLEQDDGAFISIFQTDGIRLLLDTVFANSIISIPPVVTGCTKPWDTCFDRISFQKILHLPANPDGYIVVYQRCCRDEEIVNVNDPESFGVSYYCIIKPSAGINNSAVIKEIVPQVMAGNTAFSIDNSATDIDNDSLSYEFYNPEAGGAVNNAKPIPEAPPFTQVDLKAQYASNFLGAASGFSIDPQTGMATGTTPRNMAIIWLAWPVMNGEQALRSTL